MLIATYQTLARAHRAIHALHRRFGLTSKDVGCAFVAAGGRQTSLMDRLMMSIFKRRSRGADRNVIFDAEQLSRLLTGSLYKAVLRIMINGGALVTVHVTEKASQELLLSVLHEHKPVAVVVAPGVRKRLRKRPRTPKNLTNHVQVLGGLSRVLTYAPAQSKRQ